ncbi:MAG: isochorismatase family cysteine hydrolase [Candidatus Aminicenantes bacterium]
MPNAFIPGKKVEVPDIPYKNQITLPAEQTAMIVVDMQNDFVREKGKLTGPHAEETIPRIASLLKRARGNSVRVAYSQDTMFKDDPEFDIWGEHCLINTWGWEIIDELKPRRGERVVRKNRYDAFYGTWLDHFLTRIWKVKHLVVVGTVSNICVLHTAASAGLRWFHVVIPADGISALTEFDQALTLRQVSSLYNGDVLKSSEHIQFK